MQRWSVQPSVGRASGRRCSSSSQNSLACPAVIEKMRRARRRAPDPGAHGGTRLACLAWAEASRRRTLLLTSLRASRLVLPLPVTRCPLPTARCLVSFFTSPPPSALPRNSHTSPSHSASVCVAAIRSPPPTVLIFGARATSFACHFSLLAARYPLPCAAHRRSPRQDPQRAPHNRPGLSPREPPATNDHCCF